MATFPTNLPSFSNPASTDYLNSPAHHTQHGSSNDELIAVATKVGADSSATNTTHDYKLSDISDGDKAVSTDGAQTVDGKKTFEATIQTIITESDGATVTFDLDTGNIQEVVLGGNRILAISNEDKGQVFIIKLIQDGTGSRTVTWFSTIKWAGGTVPTLTTTGGQSDIFGFITTAVDTYNGFVIGQNI